MLQPKVAVNIIIYNERYGSILCVKKKLFEVDLINKKNAKKESGATLYKISVLLIDSESRNKIKYGTARDKNNSILPKFSPNITINVFLFDIASDLTSLKLLTTRRETLRQPEITPISKAL